VSTNPTRARPVTILVIAGSLALHGGAFAAASRIPPPPQRERIEIEVVRRARPAPSQPRPEPEPERPAPPPPRRVVAVAPRAAARPTPDAPPPPLAPAPQTPPTAAPRALPKVGVSLGSTVASGGFAVAIGNTAYGRAEETAADPASVRPYAGGIVPAAGLSAQPKVIDLPKIEYPADARRAGIEGQVVLVLRIDAHGAVTGVRVVDAPAPALAEAARTGARRFRFSPALLEGEPVETEIRFTYTFLLE
jgi:protein TonB